MERYYPSASKTKKKTHSGRFIFSYIFDDPRGRFHYNFEEVRGDTVITYYFGIMLANYIFKLLFWYESKTKKTDPKKARILVIIPTYNEEYNHLKQTVESVVKAKKFYEEKTKGRVKIVLVDDGSNNTSADRVYNEYKDYIKLLKIQHSGKREAQAKAIRTYGKYSHFFINIDSDTIIEEQAIYKAIQYFTPDVGAITGRVIVKNENKNYLTKALAVRYDLAFMVERHADTAYGYLDCVSGPFSVYRAELVRKVLDRYINQTFLGKKQTYGDDRHLTNLILEQGYKVLFADDIHIYTYVPEDINTLIKQQTRWRKSFVRETIYLYKNVFKKLKGLNAKKFFLMETLKILTNTLAMFIRYGVVLSSISNPAMIFIYIIMVLLMAAGRFGYLFSIYPKKQWLPKIKDFLIYVGIHELFITQTLPAAILSITNTKWSTR